MENIRPKKSLGQHFLKSEAVVDEMIKAAEISKDDTVFEIGPGLGILTKKLLDSPAKKIIACEKDDQLFEYLKDLFSKGSNPCAQGLDPRKEKLPNKLKLIHDDALVLIPNLILRSNQSEESTLSEVEGSTHFKVVANLPYNIASPAIISLLTVCPTIPEKMVVMVQKEVAERLVTKPGNSNRGWMTVLLELMGEASILMKLSRGQFSPPPEVESAVIVIDKIEKPEVEPKKIIRILKMAFAGKRKKIKNSLFSTLQIPSRAMGELAQKAGISLDQRPEELNVNQWRELINVLVHQVESL